MEFLFQTFRENHFRDAIAWRGSRYRYGWLLKEITRWEQILDEMRIGPGTVCVVEADFSPQSIALVLALARRRCIFVPLARAAARKADLIDAACGEVSFAFDGEDQVQVRRLPHASLHPLYEALRARGHPGLVLFSSGSAGAPKAVLHDLSALLKKFRTKRYRRTTLAFLLFDHIGGVNTLFYTLANAGCLVAVPDRSPETVLKAIQAEQVELLPTSPTFLKLMLLGGAWRDYDLCSLRMVTYGTEPMAEGTLRHLNEALPAIQFLQTYGSSEVGILRSRSKGSGSTWMKVGGPEFQTRIVDGLLQIKAESAMLGYLNADSPFTPDGWFVTGDEVQVEGEYIRVLGRRSELINVGGLKVFPSEVESVLNTAENVVEAVVRGEAHPVSGQVVCARVRLTAPEDPSRAITRLLSFCSGRLQPYQVPMKIEIVDEPLHSERFKVQRGASAVASAKRPKLAFVFAGQGPRWPATGRELLREEPVFREAMEACDEELRRDLGWSVLDAVNAADAAARLAGTHAAQPATFAVQAALAALWRHWGVEPDAVVGHSMGEIAAAHCAGILDLSDAARIACHRGRVTQRVAGQGRMAWVLLPLAETRELLRGWEDRLSVAAYNEPDTSVVSGETAALEAFLEQVRGRGARGQLLAFGHGFHSPLMTPFQTEMAEGVRGIFPRRARTPIVSTVLGDFALGAELDEAYWSRNIRETVLFVHAIDRLVASGFHTFLELSPHSLLTGSVSQCLVHAGVQGTVLHSLHREGGDVAEMHRAREALSALGVVPTAGGG